MERLPYAGAQAVDWVVVSPCRMQHHTHFRIHCLFALSRPQGYDAEFDRLLDENKALKARLSAAAAGGGAGGGGLFAGGGGGGKKTD